MEAVVLLVVVSVVYVLIFAEGSSKVLLHHHAVNPLPSIRAARVPPVTFVVEVLPFFHCEASGGVSLHHALLSKCMACHTFAAPTPALHTMSRSDSERIHSHKNLLGL